MGKMHRDKKKKAYTNGNYRIDYYSVCRILSISRKQKYGMENFNRLSRLFFACFRCV